MKMKWLCLIAVASSGFISSAHAQYNTERGAVIGGLGGALAGAAIGKHNGETAGGALIGGAAGLLGGALIGNSIDAEQSRQQFYQQQYQQQVIAQNSQAVTISEVLSMTKSGVSDAVIVNHINQQGVQQRLEVSDVILLHREGVSEPVLTALQRARVGGTTVYAAPTRVYSQPVIVHDYHYVRPAYPVYAPHYYHRPHHGHYNSGTSFGFSFGH
jgi:hypothetical protein